MIKGSAEFILYSIAFFAFFDFILFFYLSKIISENRLVGKYFCFDSRLFITIYIEYLQ